MSEKRYTIRLTRSAGRDLDAIYRRIGQDSSQNAANMIERVLSAIYGLAVLPHRNIVETSRGSFRNPVRSLPVWPYVIYFRVTESTSAVTIITIRHGARRQRKF